MKDAPLDDRSRCEIPRLAGTSHAVFASVSERTGQPPQVSMRFFTETGELPACGHGTIAGLALVADEIPLGECEIALPASGRSLVGFVDESDGVVDAAFDPGPVQLREANADERGLVREALAPGDEVLVDEVHVAALGRPRLLVPISSRSALLDLRPDSSLLREGCDQLGLLGCYVHTLPTSGGELAARMFAPSIGVPEDCANANGTACLAARLAHQDMTRISVEMGDCLGSPSTITARADGRGRVRVGGAARTTGSRRLRLPQSLSEDLSDD